MTIYAIIVTYNAMRHSWIEHCLNSLKASTVPVTAIVIDNGSTDGTKEYVSQHFPDAIWLPQEKNLGFGQANNIGINYAIQHDADFILLLNQDARIDSQAIEYMIQASDQSSIISPLHLNGDGSDFDYMFKRYSLEATHNQLYYDLLISKHLKASYPIGEVAAACWFLPISIIRQCGGFNPLFFQYGEDNNYYQRLQYHHITIKLCPQAIMYHDRTQHGDKQAFNNKQFHRNVLLIVCNINLTMFQIMKKGLLLLKQSYFHDLRKRQYRIGSFLYETCWTLGHLKAIRRSRKTEKEKGLNWL